MEAVFQAIQDGIVVLDGDGRISYVNNTAEKLMGAEAGSALGRPLSKYLREIDWDRILQLDGNEWSKMISHEIEISYPERKFVSFYVTPLAAPAGHEKGILVILRDITRDRKQEASMLESERLNAVKLLAAGVAHEIGNPLNALNIHLQLIDRELKSKEPEDHDKILDLLQVARKEVSRLDLIITQFLRALRPQQPKLVQCRIDKVLKDTLRLLKQEIENRNINVAIESAATIPRIRVDCQQIKQAFFNVIKNAFQAMPDGGSLTITLSSSDRFVGISFQDSGSGISSEDFGHVLDPYYTTKSDGSGLGLMIVQRIVQDHGGAVELHSGPDAGTTVTILLPISERRMRLLRSKSVPVEDSA